MRKEEQKTVTFNEKKRIHQTDTSHAMEEWSQYQTRSNEEKLRGLTGHHVIGSNNKLLLVVVMEWEGGWCTEYLQQHLTCSTSPFTFHLPSIHLPNLLIFILLLFIPYPRSWL